MKLTFLLLLFPAILFSQLQISNINSKNVFDVMVFKTGTQTIMFSAIVLPGEIFDVDTDGEVVDIWYKPLTNICDYNDTKEFNKLAESLPNHSVPQITAKESGQWKHVDGLNTPSKWFGVYVISRTGVIPKLECKKA